MKCLKKHKRWLTTKEIEEKTGMSRGACSKNLNALYKYKEIRRKQEKMKGYYTYMWRID